MTETTISDRLYGPFENLVEAFGDTDREVLPRDAWQFIVFFAKQARFPFILLLIAGGL